MKKISAIIETGESQQSKQKLNKIKTAIFTAVFLIHYFCWHGVPLFSNYILKLKACDELQNAG